MGVSAQAPFLEPGAQVGESEPFEDESPVDEDEERIQEQQRQLSLVKDLPAGEKPVVSEDFEPLKFEGREVEGVLTKITGLTSLDEDQLVLHQDDRIRMVVEARVTGVNHQANKDGQLIRTHTVKVIRSGLAPWDPDNPADNGVLRA